MYTIQHILGAGETADVAINVSGTAMPSTLAGGSNRAPCLLIGLETHCVLINRCVI